MILSQNPFLPLRPFTPKALMGIVKHVSVNGKTQKGLGSTLTMDEYKVMSTLVIETIYNAETRYGQG
jgi:hypothetical protein